MFLSGENKQRCKNLIRRSNVFDDTQELIEVLTGMARSGEVSCGSAYYLDEVADTLEGLADHAHCLSGELAKLVVQEERLDDLDAAAETAHGTEQECPPKGSIQAVGNLEIEDGASYPHSILVTFDTEEECRKAIQAGACEYTVMEKPAPGCETPRPSDPHPEYDENWRD